MNPSRNDFTGYNEAHALVEDGIENCRTSSGNPKEERAGWLIAALPAAEKVLRRYGLDDSWFSRRKKPKLRQVVRSYILDELKMDEAALRTLAPQLYEPFLLDTAAVPEVVTKKKAAKKLTTEMGTNRLSLNEGRDDLAPSQIFVDAESMIIFDVIAQVVCNQLRQVVVTKGEIDDLIALSVADRNEALAIMPTITFTDEDVRNLTGLKRLHGWQIERLCMKAKSTLMVVTTKQKMFWEKGHWHSPSRDILTSLGDVQIDKDGVTIRRDDIPEAHQIKHRYTVCFNTVLGAIFLSNICQGKYRLLPQSFYKLPLLHQMLYRVRIALQHKRGETVNLPYSRACRLLGEPEAENHLERQRDRWDSGLKRLKEMKLLSDGSRVEGRGKKTCLRLR